MHSWRPSLAIAILTGGLLTGSAVGVAAQSAVVNGTIDGGSCDFAGEGAVHVGYCGQGRFEFDDPRLTGDLHGTAILVSAMGGEGFVDGSIVTEDIRLTNDGGSWSGQSLVAFFVSDDDSLSEPDRIVDEQHYVLTGEGGYEGLTAYLGYGGPVGVRGIILDSSPGDPAE
jgi:hypothetical protein